MKLTKIQNLFLVMTLLGHGLYAKGALDATIEAFEKKPGYVEPIATFMGTLHNAGWFTSASVSEKPSWSFGVPITVAFLQEADQFYDRSVSSNCNLAIAQGIPCPYSDPQVKSIPTIFGPKTQVQFNQALLDPANNGISTIREPADDGFMADYAVIPMLSLAGGFSIEHTEYKLKGMWFPLSSLLVDGNKLDLSHIGLGINHDLAHYFKDSELPVDFSLIANYTFWNMAFTPGKTYTGNLNVNGHVSKFGILVGKKIGDVEFLLDMGYEISQMNSSGALVKIEDNENINPNLSIEGRNGFSVGLSFVGHWGYEFLLGTNYGAQGSTTINFLQYKSKEK